jgi:hypothetical protein
MEERTPKMPTIPFKGTIKLDIRDSVQDWKPSSRRRRRMDHQTILGVGVTVEKTQYPRPEGEGSGSVRSRLEI